MKIIIIGGHAIPTNSIMKVLPDVSRTELALLQKNGVISSYKFERQIDVVNAHEAAVIFMASRCHNDKILVLDDDSPFLKSQTARVSHVRISGFKVINPGA